MVGTCERRAVSGAGTGRRPRIRDVNGGAGGTLMRGGYWRQEPDGKCTGGASGSRRFPCDEKLGLSINCFALMTNCDAIASSLRSPRIGYLSFLGCVAIQP